DDRMISSSIPDRPSQFAINKIKAYEYIDLLEGGLNGERLALKSTTTASPSKNVILDEALPWHVFTESRYGYLKYIGVTRWPEKLYKDMAAFFVRIETHPIHETPAGKRALLEYQARARRDWHDTFRRDGETFNISAINEELISSSRATNRPETWNP
ncbi:hypothetical protein BD779DRAFT_1447724, partial [Infundibulicybe gibba]